MLDVDESSFFKREEVKSVLKSVMNHEELEKVEAKASSSQASRSRGFSKDFLSKLWFVPDHLADSI